MEREERQYRPGERVPGTEYVVVRLEAEGGHGALYLVRHHFLEKKIQMLKTLRGFEPSRDLIERLKREAQMLAAMDHPHIVSVTSGGLTDEQNPRPYFVMERLKGRSLAQILPEAPEGVGVDAALKVTIEVCDALEYVHTRHGVVHRDIKPDNVFLQVTTRNGSVTKLLDFGVAHIMDLEKRYTKQNLFLGTPRYASPEQIMGDKPSPQTDLYAVGLLLYELLLGHGPFDEATNFAQIATAHVQQAPPRFPKTRRFPDGLEEIVLSLLRKKATDRPKSAEWLATQLRQIKRQAEVVERAEAQDLNRTDLSPMQNVLTGHRAHLTEAGAPPDTPSVPTLDDAHELTAPESPLGFSPTVDVPAGSNASPAVDRGAPTRSLHAPLPSPVRSDTEELPEASASVPASDAGRAAASARGLASADQGGSATASALELSTAPVYAERRRTMVIAGAAVVVVAVAAAGFLLLRSTNAGDPRASATSPTLTTAAATPTATATPTVAASPTVAATPTATPTAPPTETATAAAEAPPTPPPPAASVEPPAPRARSRAQPKPAAAPLKVPASGL